MALVRWYGLTTVLALVLIDCRPRVDGESVVLNSGDDYPEGDLLYCRFDSGEHRRGFRALDYALTIDDKVFGDLISNLRLRNLEGMFASNHDFLKNISAELAASYKEYTDAFLNGATMGPVSWQPREHEEAIVERHHVKGIPESCFEPTRNPDYVTINRLAAKKRIGRRLIMTFDHQLLERMDNPLMASFVFAHHWLRDFVKTPEEIKHVNRFIHSESARKLEPQSAIGVMIDYGVQADFEIANPKGFPVEYLDPNYSGYQRSKKWRLAPVEDTPQEYSCPLTVWHKGKIVALTGMSRHPGKIFDPAHNAWLPLPTLLADLPLSEVRECDAVSVGDKVIWVGLRRERHTPNPHREPERTVGALVGAILDPESRSWRVIDFPEKYIDCYEKVHLVGNGEDIAYTGFSHLSKSCDFFQIKALNGAIQRLPPLPDDDRFILGFDPGTNRLFASTELHEAYAWHEGQWQAIYDVVSRHELSYQYHFDRGRFYSYDSYSRRDGSRSFTILNALSGRALSVLPRPVVPGHRHPADSYPIIISTRRDAQIQFFHVQQRWLAIIPAISWGCFPQDFSIQGHGLWTGNSVFVWPILYPDESVVRAAEFFPFEDGPSWEECLQRR